MAIAAIYARKSTDQVGVSADARSVTRQVEQARAFATQQGWQVDDGHIYVDDGISGAIFGEGRPGLLQLLNALTPRPPFDILIMSEESRLGREMHQTAHLFGTIIRAGVRVWFYLEQRERTLDTAMDKMMLSLSTFAAELEREKARQRTRDAMQRKAQAGHVTGGRVFGYDNVRTNSHVERRINEAEAEVVRQIFTLAASGLGLRSIAHRLNAERAPTPRAQRGRPSGWSPSSVREVLGRSLYRGIIEWDRAPRDPERRQRKRAAAGLRVEAPQLRIVPEDLAAAVDTRRQARRTRYLAATGTLRGGTAPRRVRYLLAGLLRCTCGATYEAVGDAYGKRRGGVYVCGANRRKGPQICPNTLHLAIAATEAAIVREVEQQLLDRELVEAAMQLALRDLADDQGHAHRLAEHARLTRELGRLVAAVAAHGDVTSLVAEIRRREAELQQLTRLLAMPAVDRAELQRILQATRRDWLRVLRHDALKGRQVLDALLPTGIQVLAPGREGIPWEAQAALGPLIRAVLPLCDQVTSPPGFEPGFQP